jgi:hypothetical protein
MKFLILPGIAIAGWALGMWHASTICARQGNDLSDTLHKTTGSKGSDMILRNRMAECLGCTFMIRLWLKPWLWGRPWNDFRRKWLGLEPRP